MPPPLLQRVWGQAAALVGKPRVIGWADLFMVVGVVGLVAGATSIGREWTGEYHAAVEIDLSPWALPRYVLFSLSRGLLAYAVSLLFSLVYGYWAARDRAAGRVLVPLLDILQSIPVLGFMPGLVLALVALFPHSNTGLEIAAILMIFTGQVWNMTFSFYHSLRSLPAELREAATVYRFTWWQRFKWVELPFATIGLVWNSMMSMAGGWFFLMISESFRLGHRDFRLPGIGSYMSAAVDQGRVDAMLLAIIAMTLMIVLLDQLLWRPVVVWAQKFRVEEAGAEQAMTSWFLEWLRRARLLRLLGHGVRRARSWITTRRGGAARVMSRPRPAIAAGGLSLLPLGILLALLAFGAWRLALLLQHVNIAEWVGLASAAGWTLCRVLLSTALGTLWALPAGLAIGRSPRLSRVLQPVVQVVASFPAPMLFPLVIAATQSAGVSLGWGSVLLMLLGTQWYILFNVIAGAMAIPADLAEVARSYRITGWQRFRVLLGPAVFPYLVTGWVTAAGGAWNASIVAEYVTYHGTLLHTSGLGAQISAAAADADFPRLAASILVMAAVVVLFNRTVWRACYRLAEQRFALNR